MSEPRVHIDIDAPIDVVWDTLTDLASYPRWNPMTPRVEGELVEGNTLALTARVGRWLRTQEQRVYEVVPNDRLVWSGAYGPELVRGIRTQRVRALPDGRTRYQTEDRFYGPLKGITVRQVGPTLHRGFVAMAAALKEEAERRAGTTPATERVPALQDADPTARAGWYAVAWDHELHPGQARAITVAGRQLVLWRSMGGRLSAVQDTCGHMAARLSPGATVRGEQLICPHHGMGFEVSGTACDRHAMALRTFPVHAHGPAIVVWMDPAGRAPWFDVPALDEQGFGAWHTQDMVVATDPAHVMEDLADLDHFLSVHRYRSVDVVSPTAFDGACLSLTARIGWDPGVSMLPSLPLSFHARAYGTGVQVTEVSDPGGYFVTRHLVLPTPLPNGHTHLRLAVQVRMLPDAPAWARRVIPYLHRAATPGVAAAFRRDVKRDASLWTQRTPIRLPARDGSPSHTFGRWLAQFQPEAATATAA